MRKGYADLPEGQVHYVSEGSGDVLLLLHQSPRSWTLYKRMIPLLSKDYRVVAMDTLGFGNSDPAPPSYQLPEYAESVIHFLDALGIRRASIFGTFTGGMIGLEMAARWPERINRAVLMGLTVFLTPEERARGLAEADADAELVRPRADGSHCMNIMAFALGTGVPGVSDVHALVEDVEFVTDWIVDAARVGLGFIEMAKKVRSFDIWPTLLLISVPTLIIGLHGTNLFWGCKGERTRAAQARIPGSRLVMLEGADTDMAVTYTNASELVKIVLPFLQESKPQ